MHRARRRHRLRLQAARSPLLSVAPGLLAAALTAGCAVGPNFEPPPAPDITRYTVTPIANTTTSSDTKGGESQHLVSGRDIPGEWWTLFRSRHLTRLIERAIAENANLEAAQATLRQAHETAAAQAGTLLPQFDGNASLTRQQFSPPVSVRRARQFCSIFTTPP